MSNGKKKKVLIISINTCEDVLIYPEGPLAIAKYLEDSCDVDIFYLFDILQLYKNNGFKVPLDNLINNNYDCVLVSIRNLRDLGDISKEVINLLKEKNKINFYVGGPVVSIYYDLISDLYEISKDRIIKGEFESHFDKNCNKRSTINAQDINSIEMPDYKTINKICNISDLQDYFSSGFLKGIDWKRGCQFNCIYCSYPHLSGRKIRERDVDTVIKNIKDLIKEDIKDFFFTDCIFNIGSNVKNMLQELTKNFSKENCPDVSFGAFFRPPIEEEHINLLSNLNFKVELGIDGLTQKSLNKLNKGFTENNIKETVNLLKQSGIDFNVYVMWGGVPGQTIDDVKKEIEKLEDINPSLAWITLGTTVYPNTELYNKIAQEENPSFLSPLPEYRYYSKEIDVDELKELVESKLKPNWYITYSQNTENFLLTRGHLSTINRKINETIHNSLLGVEKIIEKKQGEGFTDLVAQRASIAEYKKYIKDRYEYFYENLKHIIRLFDYRQDILLLAVNFWVYPLKQHFIVELKDPHWHLLNNKVFDFIYSFYLEPEKYPDILSKITFFNEILYGGKEKRDLLIADDTNNTIKTYNDVILLKFPANSLREIIKNYSNGIYTEKDINKRKTKIIDLLNNINSDQGFKDIKQEIINDWKKELKILSLPYDDSIMEQKIDGILNNIIMLLLFDNHYPKLWQWKNILFKTADTYGEMDIASGGIALFTKSLNKETPVSILRILISHLMNYCGLVYSRHELLNKSLQSAISAIMSRNMSHNIGSHVLAKVSSKEPDDGNWEVWGRDFRILSQYLQQRQDFIAQIATEWPEWTYPAWLMKDLMRWFLSQKHLLNYIASSEGLGAPFYEGAEDSKPDIRFHVFKSCKKIWDEKVWEYNSGVSGVERWKKAIEKICAGSECGTDCNIKDSKQCSSNGVIKHTLLYTGKDNKHYCCLDEDIQLAIPGGIVGYHAFYTILENVIRNGAKHSFTKMKKMKNKEYEKGEKQHLKSNVEERLKIAFGEGMDDVHMDVIVEFFDEDEHKHKKKREKITNTYCFRIYDNVSFVNSEDKPLQNSDDTELVKFINNNFRQDIITETGELRKGNWGLAEMKISAGYLQRKEIQDIGMGKGKITAGDDFIIRATVSPLGTLAYEFRVPKPKEVGVVCKE